MDSNILKKLKELGKMPNEDLYNDTQEIINLARKYEELLESIERPISLEDGYFLLSILPTEKFYGNEEVISSLIESIEVREKKVSIEEYKSLVNSCTNPYVKDFLDYGVEWLEEHISQFLQGKLSSLLKQLKIIITQAENPTSQTLWEYDVLGRIVAETQNGHRITHQYNTYGNRTAMESSLGAKLQHTYNEWGECVRTEVNQQAQAQSLKLSSMVFEDIKKEKIDEMSYNEYTLYSLWNTERMFSLFNKSFFRLETINILFRMKNYLWNFLYNNVRDLSIENKLENLESLFLTEQDNVIALNMIICLDTTYNCVINRKNKSFTTFYYVYDIIQQIILIKSNNIKIITDEIEYILDNNMFIKDEINRQLSIIQRIETNKINKDFIQKVKNDAITNKIPFDEILPIEHLKGR